MTCFSIGFMRDDGDFQILATLNNNDGLVNKTAFATVVETVRYSYYMMLPDRKIDVLERQDCVDYVSLED